MNLRILSLSAMLVALAAPAAHAETMISGHAGKAFGGDLDNWLFNIDKLAELHAHLPADTQWVTPEERIAALRKRRIGAQLRRRW